MSDLISRGQKRDDGYGIPDNGQGRASDLGGRGRGSAGASTRVGNLSGGELENGHAGHVKPSADISTESKVR
jgi:hypothetical protein